MKPMITYTTLMILSATIASAQTPAATDTGYTATLRNSWNSVKRYVAASAEKMPDANYGFKPTPEVRSFGELIGHLANEHYLLCSPVKGEKNPMADVDFEKKTSKADLVKAINDSNAYCDAAYAAMKDEAKTVTLAVRDAPRHALPRHAAQRDARQRALRQPHHLLADEGDRAAVLDPDAMNHRRPCAVALAALLLAAGARRGRRGHQGHRPDEVARRTDVRAAASGARRRPGDAPARHRPAPRR